MKSAIAVKNCAALLYFRRVVSVGIALARIIASGSVGYRLTKVLREMEREVLEKGDL
jgi:hypothetical protein